MLSIGVPALRSPPHREDVRFVVSSGIDETILEPAGAGQRIAATPAGTAGTAGQLGGGDAAERAANKFSSVHRKSSRLKFNPTLSFQRLSPKVRA
jgi:hypothetical protein